MVLGVLTMEQQQEQEQEHLQHAQDHVHCIKHASSTLDFQHQVAGHYAHIRN